MTVDVIDAVRRFGEARALEGVSLSLAVGEFAAVLGPSGSGKTTLLRILAGLDFPDSGRVLIAGRDVAQVPARERGVGVVFQHYALFRHMTIAENVAFGLRVRPRNLRPAAAEIDRRVRDLLDLVQIPELAKRYPSQISGGQRQRVALARALAIEPHLLLLDEPFGALDALVRKDVRRWVRGLHDRLGITSILVTHDQEEAMEMADRVAVMERGRVVQFAAPQTLLDSPDSAFVAGFLGEATRLPGAVLGGRLACPRIGLVDAAVALPDGPAEVFVRPHELLIGPAGAGPGLGVVRFVRPEGAGGARVLVDLEGQSIEGSHDPAVATPIRGQACRVTVLAATVFGGSGGRYRLVRGRNGGDAAPGRPAGFGAPVRDHSLQP
ncbi:sulfate/molybdate ABC transporter ATP-binding protein [Humitalea sp. 24SJ18S-53]|uniref:sulfate/molybdate ABC transporter ATP-binding protein n=1 Tax=Humitalea sp. 24SJ18S-53 TaxID=3422307 RepID=UPI003D66EC1B